MQNPNPPIGELKEPELIDTVTFTSVASHQLDPSMTTTKHSKFQIRNFKRQASSIGVALIIYMSNHEYDSNDPKSFSEKHLIHEKDTMLDMVFTFFVKEHSYNRDDITNIIVGHEHGENNGRCHMQCAIFFEQECRRTIHPTVATLNYDGKKVDYLIMGQFCKDKKGLALYCQKDGDFVSIKPVETERSKGVDFSLVAKRLFNSTGTPAEVIGELIKVNPVATLKVFTQIDRYLSKYYNPNLPPFAWNIPDHIAKSNHPPFKLIVEHIKQYFFPEKLPRRKGLIILSPKNMGKTMLVTDLVSHPDYILYIRSGANSDALKNAANARLLCLDDITFFESGQIETMKGLLSGQVTGIRAAYVNQNIPALPCIMLTNNRALCAYIYNNEEHFGGRYSMIELTDPKTDYLGPPDTYDPNFAKSDYTKMYLSTQFIQEAAEKQKEYKQKQLEKKAPFAVFDLKNRELQDKMSNTIEINKLKAEIRSLNAKIADKDKEMQFLQRTTNNIRTDTQLRFPNLKNDFNLNLEEEDNANPIDQFLNFD